MVAALTPNNEDYSKDNTTIVNFTVTRVSGENGPWLKRPFVWKIRIHFAQLWNVGIQLYSQVRLDNHDCQNIFFFVNANSESYVLKAYETTFSKSNTITKISLFLKQYHYPLNFFTLFSNFNHFSQRFW